MMYFYLGLQCGPLVRSVFYPKKIYKRAALYKDTTTFDDETSLEPLGLSFSRIGLHELGVIP